MEENHLERVSGKLAADEVGQCQGHFLCRSEAVLAIKDHAVTTVQHENRCTRAVIVGLVNHQVLIFQIEGQLESFPFDRIQKSGTDIQVQGIAKFVGSTRRVGLDPCGKLVRFMTTKAALAQGAHQFA